MIFAFCFFGLVIRGLSHPLNVWAYWREARGLCPRLLFCFPLDFFAPCAILITGAGKQGAFFRPSAVVSCFRLFIRLFFARAYFLSLLSCSKIILTASFLFFAFASIRSASIDKTKIKFEWLKTSTAFLRLASVKSGSPSSLDIFL